MDEAVGLRAGVAGGVERRAGAGLRARWLRARLGLEFLVLFGGMPLLVYAVIDGMIASGRRPSGVVFVSLVSAVVLCGAVLLFDRGFDRRELWGWSRARGAMAGMLGRWAVLMAVVAGLIWWFAPERLLSFPLQRPRVWAFVMVLYPILSVYPQELVYRTFVFRRYREVFGSGWAMIWASGLAFGWGHVILQNWIAVGMTVLGGALFSYTYARTRSLAAAWVEHALYGCAVFTLGLGSFFYAGAIGRG